MKPSEEHSDISFYETVMLEMQKGEINNGLMAKAISKANGDSKKAQALYIEWKVNILKEFALAEQKKINNEEKQRKSDNLKKKREEIKRMKHEQSQKWQDLDEGTRQKYALLIMGVPIIFVLFVYLIRMAGGN